MSWDIYGEPLRRGHCEVHPYVHEEYPCSVCIADKRVSVQQGVCTGVCENEHYLSLAQEHIKELEQQCNALVAHVERLEDIIERSTLADSPAAESALEDTPETSLANRDAEQQKIGAASFRHEIMESVQAPFRPHIQGVFEVWLRRQAEGCKT